MARSVLAALIALAFTSTGCSGPGGVQVTLDEYSLDADPANAEAGAVTFRARNVGAIAHQLIVVDTNRDADDLPVKGGIVRTERTGIEVADELEAVAANGTETLEARLNAGPYVLICNIAGHYELGMRTGFLVGP